MKYQEEAEEVIAATNHELIVNRRGRYELVDADLGNVTDLRFKYLCDDIRVNRRRLDFMLENLCDWSDADSLEARASVSQDEVIEIPHDDESIPRK